MNQFAISKQYSPGNTDTITAVQPATLLSGKMWVALFPGLKTLDALSSPFKELVTAFINAMLEASVNIRISATLRPPQRAYLMHFSFLIAKGQQDPKTVPPMAGVNIEWFHGNIQDSVNAAKEMVAAYGIATSTTPPALQSNHIAGNAVDMTITGFEGKQIKKQDGTKVTVNSFDDLIQLGESYKVFHKLPDDKPHWSLTGR
jgi:hypothetical protein